LFVVAGCRQPKPAVIAPSPEGVAQVGGVSITPEEFQRLLQARSVGNPRQFAGVDAKKALLDELIMREAAYQKALASGFDQSPEIQEAVKRLIVDKYQAKESEELSAGTTSKIASEAEIENYYHEHAGEFMEPAAVRGAVIFVKIPANADADHRTRQMAKAQSILDAAKTATAPQFALLAQQNSDDQATRYQGGDTGWTSVSRNMIDAKVANTLLSLQNSGDFAPLVTTKNGVWIVKLTDSRPATMRPLAQVKDLISYRLVRAHSEQHEKALAAKIKSGLDISINRSLLESIHPSQPAPTAPPTTLPAFAQAQ
jgi:hypothetical protein